MSILNHTNKVQKLVFPSKHYFSFRKLAVGQVYHNDAPRNFFVILLSYIANNWIINHPNWLLFSKIGLIELNFFNSLFVFQGKEDWLKSNKVVRMK